MIPSVRDLSRQLAINPNTVVRAYRLLQDEEILVSRPSDAASDWSSPNIPNVDCFHALFLERTFADGMNIPEHAVVIPVFGFTAGIDTGVGTFFTDAKGMLQVGEREFAQQSCHCHGAGNVSCSISVEQQPGVENL